MQTMDTALPRGKKKRSALAAGMMVLFLLAGCASTRPAPAPRVIKDLGTLQVSISGLRNDNGQVMVSLFSGPEGFPDDVSRSHTTITVPAIDGRTSIEILDIPYGTYAISVLHDENNDGEMQTSFLGMPLEGFSFSGNPQYKFGHPAFEDVRFYLFEPLKKLALAMRYETGRKEHRDSKTSKQARHPAN